MVSVKGIRGAVLPVAVLLLVASSVRVFSAGLSSAEPLAGRNETPEIEWATASTDIPSFAEMASSGRTIRVESPAKETTSGGRSRLH